MGPGELAFGNRLNAACREGRHPRRVSEVAEAPRYSPELYRGSTFIKRAVR